MDGIKAQVKNQDSNAEKKNKIKFVRKLSTIPLAHASGCAKRCLPKTDRNQSKKIKKDESKFVYS